jgi:protein-tyrosine phosphatase
MLTLVKGPKSGHLAHFWHMVFHETKDVAVVVMLTQTIESGREKCAQYFPSGVESASMELQVEPNDPFVTDEMHRKVNKKMLGKITLKEYAYDESCRSEIRRLELSMGPQSKVVWHFLFAGWADYSKPEGADREALLQLIRTTGSKCSPDNPRVVHCSAGVGRTGTFIALDHLLHELETGGLLKLTEPEMDPVFETVNQLREQRMTMVYNEMQLQFIYEVLKERAELMRRAKATGNGGNSNGGASHLRSPKVAKLSKEFEHEISMKPELEAIPDSVPTPAGSWSDITEASDNE